MKSKTKLKKLYNQDKVIEVDPQIIRWRKYRKKHFSAPVRLKQKTTPKLTKEVKDENRIERLFNLFGPEENS